jgi:hypothetical protein
MEVRVSPAQRILQTVAEGPKPKPTPRKGFSSLIGLMRTGAPPLTDEECGAILGEEPVKKYGS